MSTLCVPLSHGKHVTVDEDDAYFLMEHRWTAIQGRHTWYAHAKLSLGPGQQKTIYLHRLIMDAPTGFFVDHINGDGLDNRRSNLRIVTASENNQNLHRARNDSRTGVLHVAWRPDRGNYQVRMQVNRERITIGTYNTAEDAEQAAREARAQYMTHAPESPVSEV